MTLKILLADDNAGFAAAVKQFLRLLPGTDVVGHARDGNEALVLACQTRPDVLLLDIAMPGKNGFEVVRAMQGWPAAPEVVFLSLNDGSAYRAMAREMGVSRFVGKADFVNDLPPMIQNLRQARAGGAASS